MALPAPTYDLMLLLDPTADEAQREKVLADAERLILAGGEVVGTNQWGTRNLAYEIRHQKDAEYHLFHFRAPRETIETVDRMLSISDGVVRYRIIKLTPGQTTGAPAPAPGAAPAEPVEA